MWPFRNAYTLVNSAPKKMSWHGISKEFANRYAPQGKWYYEVEMPGYKCNMTDIQAAMGRVQLKQLMDFHERRRKIVTHYQSAFEKIEYLVCPVEKKEVESSWHLYPLQIQHPKWKRDTFLEALNNKGIGTSVHFIPLHLHPYYKQKYGYKPTDFPIALHAFQQIFSLPLHPKLSMEHQNRIIETVIELLEEN